MKEILHRIIGAIFDQYGTKLSGYFLLWLATLWAQRHVSVPLWTIYIPMLVLATWCGWKVRKETSLKPRIKYFLNGKVYWKVEINKDNTFSVQFEPYCPIHKKKYYKIKDGYFCNSPSELCEYSGGEEYTFKIMHDRAISTAEHIINNEPDKLLDSIPK